MIHTVAGNLVSVTLKDLQVIYLFRSQQLRTGDEKSRLYIIFFKEIPIRSPVLHKRIVKSENDAAFFLW
jgi:hypothetical protein